MTRGLTAPLHRPRSGVRRFTGELIDKPKRITLVIVTGKNQDKFPSTTAIKPGQRKAGNALGQSFARLSGSDMQRRENIASAIANGISEAHARDEETAALSNDSDFLISIGFGRPR